MPPVTKETTEETTTTVGIQSRSSRRRKPALEALEAPLEPYMRPLSHSEKRRIVKMGTRLQSFTEFAETYAEANPEFRPAHFDMAAFSAHLAAAHELWNLIDKVEQFVVTLKDTLTAEGSDALEAAYVYYDALKLAARENLAGAGAQLEDLASRLPQTGPKRGGEGANAGDAR